MFEKSLNETKRITCATVIITDTQDGNTTCVIRIDTNFGQEMHTIENWTMCPSIATLIATKLADLGYTETV